MLQVTTYFRSVLPLQKILDNKSLRIVFLCEMHLMYIFSKRQVNFHLIKKYDLNLCKIFQRYRIATSATVMSSSQEQGIFKIFAVANGLVFGETKHGGLRFGG